MDFLKDMAAKLAAAFSGYKTYIAAIGLAAQGVYFLTEGRWQEAYQAFAAAMAVGGLRAAVTKAAEGF
jgi:uncharacterized membrane protein YjjP (DUF1212 family)